MRHNNFSYIWILLAHAGLAGIVYLLIASSLTAPAASPLLIYIHIVLSAIFCMICLSLWVGFAATAAMTIVLWVHPLEYILHTVSFGWMLAHWKLVLLLLALAAAYSFATYYHAPKFFSAMRNMIFILMLIGLVILPAFGADGNAVLDSVAQNTANATGWGYSLL